MHVLDVSRGSGFSQRQRLTDCTLRPLVLLVHFGPRPWNEAASLEPSFRVDPAVYYIQDPLFYEEYASLPRSQQASKSWAQQAAGPREVRK